MKHLSIITLAASLTFTLCAAEKDPKPTVATPKVAAVDAKAQATRRCAVAANVPGKPPDKAAPRATRAHP